MGKNIEPNVTKSIRAIDDITNCTTALEIFSIN